MFINFFTKVNHLPVNALRDVLLLLNNKHVVVEELLQLFVDKVDGDLLEAVVLEDLKSGDVQDSREVGFFHGGVNEGFVTFDDEPVEETIVGSSGNATN